MAKTEALQREEEAGICLKSFLDRPWKAFSKLGNWKVLVIWVLENMPGIWLCKGQSCLQSSAEG
jgi:hypothetical protein